MVQPEARKADETGDRRPFPLIPTIVTAEPDRAIFN
jgi:hypothetical protein